MEREALVPGVEIRFMRGHHPGSTLLVVKVTTLKVLLQSKGGAPARKRSAGPIWYSLEQVSRNAEVVR